MNSLCSNIIKSENIQIKGKKVIRHSINNPQAEEEIIDQEQIEAQMQIQAQLEEELARKREEMQIKLEEAQTKYDEILNKAQEESERILNNAQEEALNIEKKAYEEGHSQGLKNGYEDGYKEAYEENIEKAKFEAAQIIDNSNKVLFEANNEVSNYMKENKKNIISLSVSIAEQVLREKFEDVNSMDSLITSVIEEYELKENFVIKTNQLYKESLDEQILNLKKNHKIKGDVFVLVDESIEQGNAVIDNVNGRLVVGIDHVIEKIKEELL
ncbi:flagellar assembly protein FliH [Romboutsia lituseburensis]|uniref:flagellar assembly protein FliH n=1 Tax=Romboutsia lituseburensis TaxID=1537 RepID=UPI00215B248E|nr:flagellar assembly protein FliH [Romboutsia lituseburensis]MCR8746721.1 flagellar assembly protein FliH [Romboutsia lituseburensis]